MKVISWNVNGLRAATRKGFGSWLAEVDADFIGLQEVRALPEQLAPEIAAPEGWHTGFFPAERKGYSGVGYYSRTQPEAVNTTLGPDFDNEGRFQEVQLGDLTIANIYFPNGSGSRQGNKATNDRIPYKLDFYRAVFDRFEARKAAGEAILVIGDFNTAFAEIDIARPQANRKNSGFTDIEREELGRWFEAGWVDTWRHFNPDRPDVYTWWSQRFGIREKNIGWRIDLILASPAALERVVAAEVHMDTLGSDHCPISVTLKG